MLLFVVRVPARVLEEASVLDEPDAVREVLHETAVVRDHQQGAVVVVEGRFEAFEHLHVEVVAGLVEDEEVVVLLRELQEGHAGALPAGEAGDALVVRLVREEVRAEQVVRLRVLLGVGARLLVQGGGRLDAAQVLVVVPDADAGARADLGLRVVGGGQPEQAAQEGRLPRPVASDEGDAVAAPQRDVHVPEEVAPAEPLGEVPRVQHHVTALGRVEQHPRDALLRRRGARGGLLHALQARLHRAGTPGELRHAEPPDLHARRRLGELVDLRLLHGVPGGLQFEVRLELLAEAGEVPRVHLEAAVPQVRGARAGGVEEGAVVRDQHHRAAVAAQEAFEPLDHDDVEVVGGLVEEQHVRVLHEERRESQPRALAAGETRDGLVLAATEAEGEGARVLAGAAFVPAAPREVLQQLRVPLDGVVALGHALRRLGQFGLQRVELVEGRVEDAAHGGALREDGVLPQRADTYAVRAAHLPAVRVVLPGEEAQQGRLARPVAPHQREAVPGAHREVHAVQHDVMTVFLVDVREGQQHSGSIERRPGRLSGWRRDGSVDRAGRMPMASDRSSDVQVSPGSRNPGVTNYRQHFSFGMIIKRQTRSLGAH